MNLLTLSLEISSLRLVDFSSTGDRLLIKREERLFFSQETSHRSVLVQEIKSFLLNIKKSWGLSTAPLHCILSSDFTLLRVITKQEKSTPFISKARFVQRHAQQFLPLPLDQVSIAYQKIRHASNTLAYAAIKTDFLEAITRAIQEAGFSLQKISLLPLSLYALPVFKETLLIDLANQSANLLVLSPKKDRGGIYIRPLSNLKHGFCEQETELPLLLSLYLQKELRLLINSHGIPDLCSIIQTHSSEKQSILLSLFLKKEFSITSIIIDPCFLLPSNCNEPLIKKFLQIVELPSCTYQQENTLISIKKSSWTRFLKIKKYHISSISKFTAPSIIQFQSKQQALFLTSIIVLLVILFSSLILLLDYVENKDIEKEISKNSIHFEQQQFELKQLSQDVENKLKELQIAHNRWPLLINELQQYAPPRGLWITQLTPLSKENVEISELEVKGLYLERVNGEQLAHQYASKLASSSLFVSSNKEPLVFSCSKEDGTAYAYPFTFQLRLHSHIQL
jgi:preprotein translocase subunit SecG